MPLDLKEGCIVGSDGSVCRRNHNRSNVEERVLEEAYGRLSIWAEKHKYQLLLVLSFLISAFLRLPYFQYDFIFVDEAHWANGANTLHHGGRLYLDIALDKNPPIFWYCALLFKIFGASMTAIHLGALLLVCTASLLLYKLGASFFSKGVGAAAALIHAVAGTTYYIPRIIGMNTEILMVVFTILAALFYLHAMAGKHLLYFAAAGFFSFCGFLTKPVAGPECLMLVLFLLWDKDRSFGQKAVSLLAFISGFFVGLAAFVGHLYRTGILMEWWDQAVLYAFRYVGRIDMLAFLGKSTRVLIAFMLIFAWLFILVWMGRRARAENARVYIFLICWFAASLTGVIAGRRYYANYFLQIFPPLSLLGSLGLWYFWNHRDRPGLRIIKKICWAAFLFSFVWFHSRTLVNWFAFPFPKLHEIKLWDMGSEEKRNREIAGYIRSGSSPEDRIFIWGSKPQLLFLSQRHTVTGWMDYDIADDYPPHAGEYETQVRTAAFIRNTKPLFIADVQKIAAIEKYPVFRALIEDLYTLETRIHGSRIYRLKNQEARTPVRGFDKKSLYGMD